MPDLDLKRGSYETEGLEPFRQMARTASHGSTLTPREAALLHMGMPNNPMVITAVLSFDSTLDRDGLLSLLEDRLKPFPRFRQTIVEAPLLLGLPRWREVKDFDLRAHVRRLRLPSPGGSAALEEVVGDLSSTPLDPNRPLWRMHWIEDVEGGSVLVVRLHHCLGDGSALVSLLHALSDEASEGIPPWPPAASAARAARKAARKAPRVADWTSALMNALVRRDPASPLRGVPGPRKLVRFSEALSLDALLDTARAKQATLTALLLAAVAGALSAWRPDGRPGPPSSLHALMPVNLRAAGSRLALNDFASVVVSLPMNIADGEARLCATRGELARIKEHGQARAWGQLVRIAGVAAPALERYAVRRISRAASLVVSNVAGPSRALHWAGAAVRDLWVCAPTPGNIALSLTLISYAGRARLSALADARVVGDPRELLRSIERQLTNAG